MTQLSINKKQITLIHIAKARLGLSDSEYRELIVSMFPSAFAGSCKELTYEQASRLIDEFKEMGFEIKKPRRRRTPRNVTRLATRDQLRRIEHLEGLIRWYTHDGPERFSRKVIKKPRPATTREAVKLIEALKGLHKNQNREAHG